MRGSARLLLALAALLAAPVAPGAAQTPCAGNLDRNAQVAVTSTRSTLSFSPATVTDFLNDAAVLPGDYALRVEPRNPTKEWNLCIQSSSADLGGGKPIGALEWRVKGATSWIPLTTSPAQVGAWIGTRTVTLELRMRLDWRTDAPGTYGAPLTVTAS